MWEEKKPKPCHVCAKHSRSAGYSKKDGLGTKKQIYAMPSTGKTVEVLDMRKRMFLALKKPLLP